MTLTVLLAVLVAGTVVLVLGVLGVLALLRRQQRSVARANQVVPGTPTRAPASWAGSHDPEARLHRRLRDAVAAVRAATGDVLDGRALDLRVELEQQALAVDDALVAVAALPAAHRAEPRARATAAVEDVERAAADLAGSSVAEAADRLAAALEVTRGDVDALAQARSEVERLAAGLEPPLDPRPGSTP